MKIFLKFVFITIVLSFFNNAFAQLKYLTKVNKSTLTAFTRNQQMSVEGNKVFVTYKRGTGTSTPDREIKVSVSLDKGLSWNEKDITISNNDTYSPIITTTSSAIIVLYNFRDTNNEHKACIARSTNNGSTFSLNSFDNDYFEGVTDIVSTSNGKIFFANRGRIFASLDNANSFNEINSPPNFSIASVVRLSATDNIFWVTFNTSSDSIYIYRSIDNGASYQFVTKYFADFYYNVNIMTVAKDNKLAIVWEEEIVGVHYLKCRIIDDFTAGQIYEITNSTTTIPIYGSLEIQWTLNNIWVAVDYYSSHEVYYSDDSGITWSRGSDIRAEMNNYPRMNGFRAYDDTTVFFLGNRGSGTGSLREYIFANLKWVDFPIPDLTNDTLITNSSYVWVDWSPYVETPIYRIQLSNFSNFSNILLDTTTSSESIYFDMRDRFPANGKRYYYRIRGEDGSYQTDWSPTRSFIYGVNITAAPNLTCPPNNSNQSWPNSINFQWQSVSGADFYELHFSTSSSFNDTITYNNIPWFFKTYGQTQYNICLPHNGTVYWRVRGIEYQTGSFGPWSIGNFNHSGFPTSIEESKYLTIPKAFQIANYPNPFNQSTIIKFGLPYTSQVNISIYNTSGQKISELLDNSKIPGWYEILWTATNISSGTYFCKIKTKKSVHTIKLLLIK